MILTDYYRFGRTVSKAKSRMDCIASTNSYPEFEDRRATKAQRQTDKLDATNVGDLVIYYNNVPNRFGGDVRRKTDKNITIKSKNLSSIYTPDIANNYGYGDFRGSSDALIFVFHDVKTVDGRIEEGAVIEIFVARGKSKDRIALYNLLVDGELDEEMGTLRKQATKEKITLY